MFYPLPVGSFIVPIRGSPLRRQRETENQTRIKPKRSRAKRLLLLLLQEEAREVGIYIASERERVRIEGVLQQDHYVDSFGRTLSRRHIDVSKLSNQKDRESKDFAWQREREIERETERSVKSAMGFREQNEDVESRAMYQWDEGCVVVLVYI